MSADDCYRAIPTECKDDVEYGGLMEVFYQSTARNSVKTHQNGYISHVSDNSCPFRKVTEKKKIYFIVKI